MDSSLENPPIQVDFGKLINGQIFYITELKEVNDNIVMFSGYFRGDRIEIYNSTIEGSSESLNSFVGILDIDKKDCALINFSNLDETNYRSKIRMSTDGESMYALGRFKEGNVIVKDTTIAIGQDEPDNLILTKISLANFNVQEITRLPSCIEAVGVEVVNNSIVLAANYSDMYTLKDEDVETNSGYSDVWFSELTNSIISSNSKLSIKHSIFPNPTSNILNIEEINFDRLIIRNLSGEIFLDITTSSHKIDISSLPSQIYISSFYKSEKLVHQEKIVKASNNR